jgi:multidrug resistance efflux pump
MTEPIGPFLCGRIRGSRRASTQAQTSQVHSLRGEIQEAEAQKIQSHLQRFHRGFQRGFQRSHNQQPVVTLPEEFELAVARTFTSAGQNQQPALATIPEILSLFQQVLSGLNAHGMS